MPLLSICALCLAAAAPQYIEKGCSEASSESPWAVTAKGWNLDVVQDANFVDDEGNDSERIEFRMRDPSKDDPSGRWVHLGRRLRPDASWNQYEGLAFDICLDAGTGSYLEPSLVAGDGRVFRPVRDWAGFERNKRRPAREYMGEMPRKWFAYRLPFAELTTSDGKCVGVSPQEVVELRIGGGTFLTAILFRNLRIYRKKAASREMKPFVEVAADEKYTGNPSNVFQPEQVVRLGLRFPSAPKEVGALRWEVADYWGRCAASGSISMDGVSGSPLEVGKLPTGYYELRVWPHGKSGQVLSEESVVVTSGTMEKGVQTFAVVPRSVAENVERMKRHGVDEFFGIMNSRDWYRLPELTGASWCLEGARIEWYKPSKVLAESPRPSWQNCVLSLVHSVKSNQWYKGPPINCKRMRNGERGTDEYKRWIAEVVRSNVHRHPDMAFRPYELSWEADLSCPPHGNLDVDDLVEWWRIVGEIVRANDPRARIWGPKCTHNPVWFEKALAAGIGKYLDAISMHFYIGPVPEDANLPGSFNRIRSWCRKYIGRELPIYNTEGGYYRQPDPRTHAQKLMRYAAIQKGEGVGVYLLFFIFDFWEQGHVADYGLFFNPTWPLNFGPPQIYPKPAYAAYAVMVDQLSGLDPVGKVGDVPKGVYGYQFADQERNVAVLWSPYRRERVRIATERDGLQITDIMGGVRDAKAKDGFVEFELSPDICYVSGFDGGRGRLLHVEHIPREVEFAGASVSAKEGVGRIDLCFRNTTARSLTVPVSFETSQGKVRSEVACPPRGRAVASVPFEEGAGSPFRSPGEPLHGVVGWRIGRQRYEEKVEIGFLRAFREGTTSAKVSPFSNSVRITNASQTNEHAEISLFYSRTGLHLLVEVADAEHCQRYESDSLWMGDSLQIGIDTAPDYAYEYDELIAQTKKKVSDFSVALTPTGIRAYRHHTFSEKFLKTGEIRPDAFARSRIVHHDGVTKYDLLIPWEQVGLTADEIHPGQKLGFSLLVNSRNQDGGRSYYGLFGGIADGSGFREYGYFTLE